MDEYTEEVADQSRWATYCETLSEPRPHYEKRMVAWVVAALAAVIIIAGTVAIIATAGTGNGNADAAVVSAVSSVLGDRTASLTLSGSVDAGGQNVPVIGSGMADFTRNAMQLRMQLGNLGLGNLTEEADYVGNVMYINMGDLIGQILPGKSWVSMDLSQLAAGQPDSVDLSGSSLTNDPVAALKLLAEQGNTATELGPSTIDGVAVEGYSVKMNQARLRQEVNSATLPTWLRQTEVSVSNPNLTYVLYITQGGLLDRMTTDVSLSTGGQKVVDALSMDFAHFGLPVAITAPPIGQVGSFAQFEQAAQSGAGSMGGAANPAV
jgi:hypothetical protein